MTGPLVLRKPCVSSAMRVVQTSAPVRASSAMSRASAVARKSLSWVDGEVAARAGELARLDAHLVLPDQVAGARVEGLHDRAEAGEVEHAAVRDRRGRVPSALVHGPHPLQLQLADVVPRDRVERAVAPGLVVPPHHQPVARIGIAQSLVGDRREVLHLARDRHAPRHGRRRRARVGPPRPALGPRGYRRRRVRLTCRHVADRDGGGGGQRLVAGGRAVRREQVCDDVEIGLLPEAARAVGGHRYPNPVEQLLRGAASPVAQEVRPRQGR